MNQCWNICCSALESLHPQFQTPTKKTKKKPIQTWNHGTLEVGTDVKRHSQTKIGCSNLSVVGTFVRGCIDITMSSEFKTIKYVKITV